MSESLARCWQGVLRGHLAGRLLLWRRSVGVRILSLCRIMLFHYRMARLPEQLGKRLTASLLRRGRKGWRGIDCSQLRGWFTGSSLYKGKLSEGHEA